MLDNMKKHLITLCCLLVAATNALAQTTPPPPPGEDGPIVTAPVLYTCDQAIRGTCAHWAYGDGKDAGIAVEVEEGIDGEYFMCSMSNPVTDVTCTINTSNCPNPPSPGVDGHNMPISVTCEGCYGASSPMSIEAVKCCIIHGFPTGPLGETHCEG